MEEFMAIARMAAAKAQRRFPCLSAYAEDVTQNAYLAMLRALHDVDGSKGKVAAFIYLCCYRFIVCGLLDRNDYRFRHGVRCQDVPEQMTTLSFMESVLVSELLSKSGLTGLEEAVLEGIFRDDHSTVSLSHELHCSHVYVSRVKTRALAKIRATMVE